MCKRSRISNTHEDVLPVELLQHVQSLLSLKEATSTCVLSKSWQRAWYTIPNLEFIPPEPDKLFSSEENETKYKKLIHTTLERYHKHYIPIQSFRLQLRLMKDNLEDALNWIRRVASKTCLKDLSIDLSVVGDDYDSLTLPNELFSSQNLITINVKYATHCFDKIPLRISTNSVINCVSLRAIDFECVIIPQDVFQNLLSTCTLLEKIRLWCCEGLKIVKVKNLLRLRELDILSSEEDDFWEINNVPSLCSFRHRPLVAWWKPVPFQMDSLSSVTSLHIDGVIIDNSFFNIVESEFPLLESLTLTIGHWEHENMVITSASLKWLTLDVYHHGPVNAKVNAPRLLSFTYTADTGNVPRLLFPTVVPAQIKLTYMWWEPTDHSFFLKMRETLNLSSKFDINIKHGFLDSVVPLDIDVDELRSMVSHPVTGVQLSLETRLDEHVWEQSRFFDAFFSICRPNYIRASDLVIKKMMEWNKSDINVQLKNRENGKWEALTSSWRSVLDTLTGTLECKLNWLSQ